MIFILAILGFILVWMMKYLDAKTKFEETFNITRWVKDSIIAMMAGIIGSVICMILVSRVPDTVYFHIADVPFQAKYILAFMSGYSGTGLVSRISSIVENIIK